MQGGAETERVQSFYAKYFEAFGLALGNSEERGRHVCVGSQTGATKGSFLFRAQPYAAVLRPAFAHSHCRYCFAKLKKATREERVACESPAVPCSKGCKYAFYCNRDCERTDWEMWHEMECEGLRNIYPPTMPNENVMLMWRVANRRRKEQQRNEGEVTWEVIDFMITHRQDYDPQEIKHFEYLVDRYFLPFLDEGTTKEHIVSFFCFFFCNNFTIYDTTPESIGLGVYPSGALMNHSCRPNTAVTFEGNVALIRAIEDVPPSGEITINYVEIEQPRKARRAQLLETFFFHCTCEWCLADTKEEEELEDQLRKARQLHDQGALCKQEGNLHAAKAAFEESLAALQESLPERMSEEREGHYRVVATLNELVDVTFILKEWEECLEYCRRAVKGLQHIFGSHCWVMTGLRMLRIAFLCAKLCRRELREKAQSLREEGITALRKAEELLEITHGKDHSVFEKDVQRIRRRLT